MNTNDFTPLEYETIKPTPWSFMFREQEHIFRRYMITEGIPNWDAHDFSIDCLEDQEIFKDFLMNRVVEEITEATVDLDHPDHFLEEIVDALNFLLEAYIIYGWNYSNLGAWTTAPDIFEEVIDYFRQEPDDLHQMCYRVVEAIGACTNLLKNRKWKSSQYLVDLLLFEERFKEVWTAFNVLCVMLGITEKRLFEVWSQKLQCNIFRLETRY